MKKNLISSILFALFLIAGITSGHAQFSQHAYTTTNIKSLGDMGIGDTLNLHNVLTSVPQASTSWQGDYAFINEKGSVILKIREDLMGQTVPETFTCIVTVSVKTWLTDETGSSLRPAVTIPLTVTYDKRSGLSYDEAGIQVFNQAQYLELSLVSVSNVAVKNLLQLQLRLDGERFTRKPLFDIDEQPCIYKTEYLAGSNEWQVLLDESPLLQQADEIDLEWTFIDFYDEASYSSNPMVRSYDFRNNATRVVLGKNQRSFIFRNIFEKGFVVFRYRTVGYYQETTPDGPLTHRFEGKWSIAGSGTFSADPADLETDECNDVQTSLAIIDGTSGPHLPLMNWQYISVFAEEGKKKETISYYDGSMRGRQTVASNEADDKLLVQENIYDYNGRAAIQVLPVPIEGVMSFYPGLNKKDATTPYTAAHFDQDIPGNECLSATSALDPEIANSASEYYSVNNPFKQAAVNEEWDFNQFIPVAGGFPFTQTVYMNDNTGRVAAQSGVGETHKIGSGHETRYAYETPFSDELTRLFGTDVGYAAHYKKSTTIDANGQASVSYTDLKGKVIATSLAEDPTGQNKMDALPGISLRAGVEVSLLNSSEVSLNKDEYVYSKRITVLEAGTYKFLYSVQPQHYEYDGCPVTTCYDCVYDLDIRLTSLCGEEDVLVHKPIGGDAQAVNLNAACENGSPYSFGTDASLTTTEGFIAVPLAPGTYTITRSLRVSEQAYRNAEQHYMQHANCKTLADFVTEAENQMDPSGCFVTCETCTTQFENTTLEAFLVSMETKLGKLRSEFTPEEVDEWTFFYHDTRRKCEELNCNGPERTECDVMRDVLAMDMSPGGQYMRYDYLVTTEGEAPVFTIDNSAQNELNNLDLISSSLKTWINGIQVNVNSLTPEQFVANWDPAWTDEVIKRHPEYCRYTFCLDKEVIVEHEYEVEAIQTYAQAAAKNFVSGTIFFANNAAAPEFIGDISNKMASYRSMGFDPGPVATPGKGDDNEVYFISVVDLVLFELFYPESLEVSMTYNQFRSFIDATDLEACDGAYKDLFWQQLKILFLSEHRRMFNQLAQGSTCNPAIPTGLEKRFYYSASDWPGLASQPDETYAINGVADQCGIQCESYKEIWKDNLAGCDVSGSDLEDLLEQLKGVCINGCDVNNPLGSRTVSPANFGTSAQISFEQVMRTFAYGTPPHYIYDGKVCSDLLITMPAAYGHDYFASSSPYADTCACDADVPPADCPCSTKPEMGMSNTMAKMLRPGVTEEQKCKRCVDCSETANAFYDFTTVYPVQFAGVPAYETGETQERMVKFLNQRLGMNLTFDEYETHLAECMGFDPNLPSGDIFALYAETYFATRARSMKEVGLVASNIRIPAQHQFKYEYRQQEPDGYVIDYRKTAPVYASVSEQLMYIQSTYVFPGANYFKPLDHNSLYTKLDCVCPKVVEDRAKYLNLKDPMIVNPGGSSDPALFNRIYNICKERQDALQKCWDNNQRIAAENNFSLENVPYPYQWMIQLGIRSCREVDDRIADLLKGEPLNITFTTKGNSGEGFGCPFGEGGGGSNPGGPVSINPGRQDCEYLMPKFQAYYDEFIKDDFESTKIHQEDLKTYLSVDYTGYQALVTQMNAFGANINTGLSQAAQVDRLWDILKICRAASCQNFMTIATTYDEENETTLTWLGKGLHDLAAEGSSQAVYTGFKAELNTELNKPPFLTFFDDETVSRHFASCAQGPCEAVLTALDASRTANPTEYSGTGSTVQKLRHLAQSASPVTTGLLSEANALLRHAPYFKTFNINALIAAVEMCESCQETPAPVNPAGIADVIGDLMGVNAGGAEVASSVFKHFLKSGWKIKDIAPHIYNNYFSRNPYADAVTYNVVSTASDNSWMYGEARPPAGNYFYVRMATITDNYTVSDPHNYLPVTPDGDFAFANITAITVNRVVNFSPMEIRMVVTATYKSIFSPGNTNVQKLLVTVPSYGFYKEMIAENSCKHNATVCNKPISEFTVTVAEDPCIMRLRLIAKANAYHNYQEYLAGLKARFRKGYVESCMSRAGLGEQFRMKYDERQYQYTLYYYDQAGNLVKTVPPAGVQPLGPTDVLLADTKRDNNEVMFTGTTGQHAKITRYRYNTLNQLAWQNTPDAGTSLFWYDKAGRIVLSQNQKQSGATVPQFSYTFYDGLWRITETGQLQGLTNTAPSAASVRALPDFNDWILSGTAGAGITRSQITRTFYDAYDAGYTATPGMLAGDFANTRGRVVHSAFYESATIPTPEHAVHYSYDIHGNVKTLYREISELSPLGQNKKQVDYEYDLVSGKVNRVLYQDGKADQFEHLYVYDKENRLRTVKTGTGSGLEEEDANYYYYLHGPLARMEYGAHDVQGLDYTYTVQGWLKSVNAGTLDYTRDPGRDGHSANPANRNNARDVFGFELSYFRGDYIPAGSFLSTAAAHTTVPVGAAVHTNAPDLYNGNIRYMVTSVNTFKTLLSAYQYDQLNRLKKASYFDQLNTTTNTWGTGNAMLAYANTFTYDKDGNIEKQTRNGKGEQLDLDDLTYTYEANTNRLIRVDDTKAATSYGDDIDDQSGTNYTYDAIGNLTGDAAEEIAEIRWNVYGKITSIIRTTTSKKPNLIYTYTPDGHRASKTVIPKNGLFQTTTYYVRDAQGNVLATYGRRTSRVLDLEGLSFAEVNNKLYDVLGATQFGNFIGAVHTGPVNNAGFRNNLHTVFSSSSLIGDRLKELSPVSMVSGTPALGNWLYTQSDPVVVLDNVFGGASISTGMCNCTNNNGPYTFFENIAMRPHAAIAFINALCSFDADNGTNYSNDLQSVLFASVSCPLSPAMENDLSTWLDPLNSNAASYAATLVTELNKSGWTCKQVNDILIYIRSSDPMLYTELLAAFPDNVVRPRWTNYTSCGGSFAYADMLDIPAYRELLLKAINRFFPAGFSNLVTNAGFTFTTPAAGLADLAGLSASDLEDELVNMSLHPGSPGFGLVLDYMNLLDPFTCNSIFNESFISALYKSSCTGAPAYPCISILQDYVGALVNANGLQRSWDQLYEINSATYYAGQIRSVEPEAYYSLAGRYHKTEISAYQQANKAALYGDAPMNEYFNYIRTMSGTNAYNTLISYFMGVTNHYSDSLKLEEWMLYGSSRLGSRRSGEVLAAVTYSGTYSNGSFSNISYIGTWEYEPSLTELTRERGKKRYELSNHLGNVLAVISDKKLYHDKAKEFLNFDYTGRYGTMLPSNVTISIVSNRLNASTLSSSQIIGIVPVACPAGKSYKVSFDLTRSGGVSGVTLQLVSDYSSGSVLQYVYTGTANGTHTYIVPNAPDGIYAYKFVTTGTGNYTIDNFKIEEYEPESLYYMAEVISATDYSAFGAPLAGRHYDAPTEPVVKVVGSYVFFTGSGTGGWQGEGSGSVAGQVFDNLKVYYGTGGNKGIKQTLATEPNKTYRIRFALNAANALTWPIMYLFDKTTGVELKRSNGKLTPGEYIFVFKATSLQTEVKFMDPQTAAGEFWLRYFTWEEVLDFGGVEFGGAGGQEKDDEIFIGAYTAEFWEYDSRLGRRWNVDPAIEAQPWMSSYQVFSNSPLTMVDPSGALETNYEDENGNSLGKTDDGNDATVVIGNDKKEEFKKELSAAQNNKVDGSVLHNESWIRRYGVGLTAESGDFVANWAVNAISNNANMKTLLPDLAKNAKVEQNGFRINPTGPALIILGSRLVPKFGGVGGGGAAGSWTSIASKTLRWTDQAVQRKLIQSGIIKKAYQLPAKGLVHRYLGTRAIGGALGRAVPYLGWGITIGEVSWELGKYYGPSKWYGDDDSKYFE